MRPPSPWDEGTSTTTAPEAEPPPPEPTTTDDTTPTPPNEPTTTNSTTLTPPNEPTTANRTTRTPPNEPTAAHGMTLTPPNQPTTAHATTLAPPNQPAAADGEQAPLGPPAPDDECRTGGAGGKQRAEGEAEAETETEPRQRILGLLLGLAAGDAAGWPAARHRAARMPDWTRRLTRELDTFAEHNATTTLPVPIALNQPPEPLRLGPSDDAEWAVFAAEAVLRAGDDTTLGDLSRERRTRAAIDLTWSALADEIAAAADRAPEVESAILPLRARISVRAGLGNLATGLRPPATGHDNPHYFDDAACVRACVLAVAHPGDPHRAAELAEFDARYTQDGDGVHGARAMAAAVALALTGAATKPCVAAALAELPEETEIGRNARHALHLAHSADSAFALIPLLEHQIVDHVYSYGIAAAETVPVALALTVAADGRIAEAVPAAACLSRVADSAPALAGALTGALGGGTSIPATWREACRTLSGCVLPRLTGTDLVELAGLLEATQPARPGG
ncbi:ADP-ribosylglycohydrolase family protein [Streptomyces caeruleatus]|uniref:Adhesin n=1 Tax=Streptomyces caeruleatus TaxID=661399 RepID=A0A117RQM5_9ACTN|nr:ADP-ribosylglycohydrolase family protein [Streptomyces caeruleatus]KUO03902.1 adhesin [Streptomyces caeruleatus]